MTTWGRMRSFFLSDEELGKKDDDHKPFKNGPNWHPARVPPRRSLRRIGLVSIVALLVYLFFKNIPVLGPDHRMRRPNYAYPDLAAAPKRPSYEQAPPSRPDTYPAHPATPPGRTFNGPVKFLELAPTLHAIGGTRGTMVINRNVLFAASSLKSAATLFPIACQMGTELKSYVHFALMSRSGIDIQELRKVNGIDDSCHIIFHDARPDYAQISTDDRMENAVFRAFHHIYNYMHPQAILVDGSSDEEPFFLRAAQQHMNAKKNTLIELPRKSAKRLEWITKLDSQALRIELSPQFFHYLKYSLLEYRYSAVSTYQHWDRRLFGISLEQPLQLLDGKEALSLPSLLKGTGSGDQDEREISTSFLWQAPTSNAVLFLGEKWTELHDFVSRSLEAKQDLDPTPALLSEKVVSTQYPSWLEHALRLARARGYWMLYPGDDTARNLATVHNELNHMPEEYSNLESSRTILADDASEEEIENVRQKIRLSMEIPLAPVSLLDSLPNKGNLRPFGDLPILTWDGLSTEFEELNSLAVGYAKEFKEKVGGCSADSAEKQKKKENLSTQDLFCLTD
ncbi:hypothetical protein AAE478_001676 [Parahypoxylon ruwenzoriense]